VSTRTGRPTLATIARAAGVSVATVSKVLNGRDDVAPATRALVQDLLQRHYYVGRGQETRHPTIELIFHGPLSAYSTEVIEGVLDAAMQSEVAVVLSKRLETGENADPSATAWALGLAAAGRQAVISVCNEMPPGDLAALDRAALPLLVLDPLVNASADITSVGSTNYAGGLSAAQHLLALGHRDVGYVGGDRTAACNQARLHGFRGAMEAAGYPVPEDRILQRKFRYEEGLDGGAALLDRPDPPTAIFAGNDEIAVGVIEAARARDLRVPDDLSVVGFDDTQVARMSSPPLTTVRQPLRDMGSVALRTALQLAAGDRVDSHHVELATTLIVRHSTAPPRPSR
jgi:LacI family transcriptional regulator, galactose operon repressor